jgi:5-(carboxyamino)imidazole ribonucleotide synthase
MRIGIIGAGQLGQMLGFAANALGHECRFLDPAESPPAAAAGHVVRAGFDDPRALAGLADDCDVLTYEFENVPVASLSAVAGRVPVHPPLEALARAQDRLEEKRLFGELDIPLAAYRQIDSEEDLRTAAAALGLPLVVKTRRFGYDGKGQFVVRECDDIAATMRALGERPAVAETFVEFDYEVSLIGVRSRDGDFAAWPLTENRHADGILRTSRAPIDAPALEVLARDHVERLLDRLDYVGVLALEFFAAGGELLANEFAPRVHNSGHWTIEGAETSQFTNHILAITGSPPGPTGACGHAGMVNLIGTIGDAVRGLAIPGCTLHDYGKAPRPGRKLGHVTVVAETASLRDRRLEAVAETVTQSTPV